MTFRSIETLASDMLRKIEAGEFPLYEDRHTGSGGSDERAPRPVAPLTPGREAGQRMEKKAARASVRAELPPFREEEVRENHGGVAGMDMATVSPKSERPRSAVVISMLAWKKAHGHTAPKMRTALTTMKAAQRPPATR